MKSWTFAPDERQTEELAAQISEASGPATLWSPLAPRQLLWWLDKFPHAKAVVFCESPGHYAADKILSHHGATSHDYAEILGEWDRSADDFLSVRRNHSPRVMFVDFEEATCRPELFGQWLQMQSLGISLTSPNGTKDSLRSTLTVLANNFAESRARTPGLWQEMQASCQPLDPSWPTVSRSHSVESALEAAVRSEASLIRLREQAEDSESQLSALQAANGGLLREQEELAIKQRDVSETLLRELQSAFRESEDFFERLLINEGAMGKTIITFEGVSYGYVCEESPHQHLDLHFKGVGILSDFWPSLRLRIVQHFGRSGIALFQPDHAEGRRPLHPWEPTGEEEGIPLVLLMPRDKPVAELLGKLPGKDIFFLRELVLAAVGHINAHGLPSEAKTDWAAIGREFIQEIDELPTRLHYDCLDAVREQQKDRASIYFNVYNAYFRGRLIPNLGFRWTTDTGLLEFAHARDTTDRCILVKWPSWDAVSGKPRDFSLVLSGENEKEARQAWHDVPKIDRDFLRSVVMELPSFCHHYAEQNASSRGQLPELVRQAKAMTLAVQSLDQPSRRFAGILGRAKATR